MSFSSFFISRPIFAAVISITIVIAGLMAARGLPIAQYPQIAPPTVIITANYPGASTETLTRTVAGPIEEQLSGVENLLFFNSVAQSSGTLVITAITASRSQNRVCRISSVSLVLPLKSVLTTS